MTEERGEAMAIEQTAETATSVAAEVAVAAQTTIVIFRKWQGKNGGVIALFPFEPGTSNPSTCDCYEHVGRHGACWPGYVVAATLPCVPEDYADLKTELESPPYNYRLEVLDCVPSGAYQARVGKLNRQGLL